MITLENAYCRLCAELKPSTKLVNLLNEVELCEDIVKKLKKMNVNIDFSEGNSLPRTVCYTCKESINIAFNFISGIEKAQEVLEDLNLVKNIKKEYSFDTNDSNHNESDIRYDVNIKVDVDIKLEGSSQSSKSHYSKNTNKHTVKEKKNVRTMDSDDIPLSQFKLSWQDYSWQCAYCDTLFPNLEELKSHSIQFHKCCNPYQCTDCKSRKLKLDRFVAHVKRHRKYLKFSCYRCHEKFYKITESKPHYKTHMDSKFSCTGCNETFKTSEELNNHSNAYNRDLKIRQLPVAKEMLNKSLICPICQKSFRFKGTLRTHLLTHTERKRDHTCEKCGKRFLCKQSLNGHMMLHNDERPYPCEICKSRFRTRSHLRLHVSIHDGIKPFKCDQCGRCFRLKSLLADHSVVHTDTLPYVCSYCNRGFRFRGVLNQHIRQHTGIKPFSCQHCDKSFKNWSNYNVHMKQRHGVNMAKRRQTEKGFCPVDLTTGQVVPYEETNKTNEWKNELLNSTKLGRPKGKPKTNSANAISDKE